MILSVIGTGRMGQALINRFTGCGQIKPENIRLCDAETDKMNNFAQKIGAKAFVDPQLVVSGADIILLAVKPQQVKDLLLQAREKLTRNQVIVSIAAGVTLGQLRQWSGTTPAIVRVMPNLPVVVGGGVCAICFDRTEDKDQDRVEKLFSCCGLVYRVTEEHMDAVTGLSGSGPAYAMLIIEALADGGVLQGLPREQSLRMAAMTIAGAAQLYLDGDIHPAELKDQICSPGGTSIEGVRELEKRGLRSALIEAVARAAEKSKELGRQTRNEA